MKNILNLIGILIISIFIIGAVTVGDKQNLYQSNFLTNNSGLENGLTGYTASIAGSLTLITTAASVANGMSSGLYSPSTAGNFMDSSLSVIPKSMTSRQCEADVLLKGCGDSISASVIDNSGSTAASMTLQTYTDWFPLKMFFPCGMATGAKLRLTTLGAANNCAFDDIVFGDAYKMGLRDVSQSQIIGTKEWVSAYTSWTTVSTVAGSFAAASYSGSITYTGNAVPDVTDSGKIPRIRILNLPAGTCTVSVVGSIEAYVNGTGTGTGGNFYIHDGSTLYNMGLLYTGGASSANIQNGVPNLTATITYNTAQTDKTFTLYARAVNTNTTVRVETNIYPALNLKFTVFCSPSSTQIAQTPEYVNRVASVKWYSVSNCVFTNAGAEAVMYDADCGLPTTILGSGVSGTSGYYQMTVSNIPVGKYKLEANGYFRNTYSGAAPACIYSLVDDSSYIMTYSGGDTIGTSNTSFTTLSGVIEYTSFQPSRTFKVIGWRSGAGGSCDVVTDAGTRQTQLTLIPLDQGLPLPNILNSVSTPASGGVNIASAGITMASTASASISSQDGSWITSITGNGSTGDALVGMSIAAGTFSSDPRCFCTPNTTSVGDCVVVIDNKTYVEFRSFNSMTGAAGAYSHNVFCVGGK